MSKTNYKHILAAEEMREFMKVRSICTKLALVSQAKPVELSLKEIEALTDYFPDLKTMVDSAAI